MKGMKSISDKDLIYHRALVGANMAMPSMRTDEFRFSYVLKHATNVMYLS